MEISSQKLNHYKQKKILHLITGLELGGGAENMLLQFLPRMQDELDNKVCVIKGRGKIAKKLEEKGIPVYYLGMKNIFDLRFIIRYHKVLKEFSPDVQINYLIHADIFGRIFGKMFRVKKIISYIRNIHRSRKFLMFLDKITLPLADSVLTNSETAKEYYIDKMGVKKNRIKCIPNAVDISRFESAAVDKSKKLKDLNIPENSFIIGCVARLEKQKDIPTLIRAFALLQKRHTETHLIIVGHGTEKKNLHDLIKKLELEGSVLFLEKRKDMPEVYKVFDLFVLPSLNEGMSNALLEAMSARINIIASDIDENRELIKDEYNGRIFKVNDEKDLLHKILFYLNQYKSEIYRNNAYTDIKNNYDLEIISRKYIQFLENC